jgi:RNA polymerase sigma factor (sigma-70 family)
MIEGRGAGTRGLRALFDLGPVGDLSDGELLDRCSRRPCPSAEAAFEVLVGRHGGMVLKACRRVLGDPHDADDAFQATFLVLASRAGSIRRQDSLASWLYGVALRVASNARRSKFRRGVHERKASRHEEGRQGDPGGMELARVIAEELARLPDRFRAAVVLCDLEGLSHEEAARRLGCPPGTIKSRQARGRDRLRGLLTRRGLAPSVVTLGLASIAEASLSAVPASLTWLTIRASSQVARGGAAASITSAAVAALSEGTLKAMFLIRLRLAACTLLLLGTASIGVGVASRGSTLIAPQTTPTAPTPPVRPAAPEEPDRQVLRQAASAIRPTADSFYALIEIARAQARTGDREGARETAGRCLEIAKEMDQTRRVGPLLYAAWTLEAVGDHGGASAALRLADEIIDGLNSMEELHGLWELSVVAAADIDRTAGLEKRLARFRKLIEAVPEANGRFGHVMYLVRSLAYVGDYEQAFAVADQQGGGDDYIRGTYLGCLADGAASLTSYSFQPRRMITPESRKAGLEVLRRIEKIVEPFEFAEQRRDVDLARAFARLGDFESALRAARRIGRGPIRYRHMIDLTAAPYALHMIGLDQAKSGRLDDARRTFREALDLIATDPNLATPIGQSRLVQIAMCQVDAGDFEGAMKTADGVSPQECQAILTSIAMVRTGDREAMRSACRLALEVIGRQVRERGDRPTDPEKARMASLRARMGEFGAAVEILSTIADENARATASAEVARTRASSGDVAGVLTWTLSLDPPALRISTLRGLAEGIGPVGARGTR